MGRVQNEHDPQLCEESRDGKGEGREGDQGQQPRGQRYKKGQVTKMPGLYREEPLREGLPSPCWAGVGVGVKVWGQGMPGRNWGLLGEPRGQVCFRM